MCVDSGTCWMSCVRHDEGKRIPSTHRSKHKHNLSQLMPAPPLRCKLCVFLHSVCRCSLGVVWLCAMSTATVTTTTVCTRCFLRSLRHPCLSLPSLLRRPSLSTLRNNHFSLSQYRQHSRLLLCDRPLHPLQSRQQHQRQQQPLPLPRTFKRRRRRATSTRASAQFATTLR